MRLQGKELLFYVINRIEDQRQISPIGQSIHLDNREFKENERFDVSQIMRKLENDEKIIKVKHKPDSTHHITIVLDGDDEAQERAANSYSLEILEGFDDYLDKLIQTPEYQRFADIKPSASTKQPTEKTSGNSSQENRNDILFTIEYNQTSGVVLNEHLQIAKPDFMSENDLVMEYLYQNPNRVIKKEEIEKAQGITLKKELKNTISKLGFKGGLEKVFFSLSKNGIEFKNPVTQKQFHEMKVGLIKFRPK